MSLKIRSSADGVKGEILLGDEMIAEVSDAGLNVTVGGVSVGGKPLDPPIGIRIGQPMFWTSRERIQSGDVPLDGQEMSQFVYPDLYQALLSGMHPTVSEEVWQSDASQRGKFVVSSSPGMFRVADYNGQSMGSLGAAMPTGDGKYSSGEAGIIQRNAPYTITGVWVIKAFNTAINAGEVDAAQLATDFANLDAQVKSLRAQLEQPQVWGSGTLLGKDNVIKLPAVATTLGLEVGDVIELKVSGGMLQDGLTQQTMPNAVGWASCVVHNNYLYVCVNGGTAATGGVWRRPMGDSEWEQVYTGILSGGHGVRIVAVGDDLYIAFDGSRIIKAPNADFSAAFDLTTTARRWFGLATDGERLFGCVYANLVYQIDLISGAETAIDSSVRNWRTLAWHDTDGTLYAGLHDTNQIWKYDWDVGLFQLVGSAGGKLSDLTYNAHSNELVAVTTSSTIVGIDLEVFRQYPYVKQAATTAWTQVVSVHDGVLYYGNGANGFFEQGLTMVMGEGRLHTVEKIIDGDTIAVNYEHAAERGNGSLKLSSQAGSLMVRRITKWYLAPHGLGQDWVNVEALRPTNVDVINTTSRLIYVSLNTAAGNVLVNGETFSVGAAAYQNNIQIPIPAGGAIRAPAYGNRRWMELR